MDGSLLNFILSSSSGLPSVRKDSLKTKTFRKNSSSGSFQTGSWSISWIVRSAGFIARNFEKTGLFLYFLPNQRLQQRPVELGNVVRSQPLHLRDDLG
jgi:hypothetical protein